MGMQPQFKKVPPKEPEEELDFQFKCFFECPLCGYEWYDLFAADCPYDTCIECERVSVLAHDSQKCVDIA